MNDRVIDFLADLFESSGSNRLPTMFGGGRIFDAPMIGVSAANDPIIDRFTEVVSPVHMTPAQMWSRSARLRHNGRNDRRFGRPVPDEGPWTSPEELSDRIKVLSLVFPYSRKVLADGCGSSCRTPLTGLALNLAQAFHTVVFEKMSGFLADSGHRVMVPQWSRLHSVLIQFKSPYVVSTWSERHYAFVAGLGTFGLAEHLITERGCNVRLASFLTDAPLDVTPRTTDDPFGNCLHFTKGNCAKCATRCPRSALTAKKHRKLYCELIRHRESARVRPEIQAYLKPITRRFMHVPVTERPIGCGVCQYDVPCMDRNPMADTKSVLR